MIDYELLDKKERFSIILNLKTEPNTLFLKNILVYERYRDRGFAKRIVYTIWRVAKILNVTLIVVNVISPIIENIVKKYYIYKLATGSNELYGYSYIILDLKDYDYSESILSIFLDIYYYICPK